MRKLVREMLTGQKLLGISDSTFIDSLVNIALALYADRQPQLVPAREKLQGYVSEERGRFESTLKSGLDQLECLLRQDDCQGISGEDMLALVKRHGVPWSLLEVWLRQRGVPFDRQAYHVAYTRWYQNVTGENVLQGDEQGRG
jgi:alanyl-tRNA synthetase